jgi:hypothetical protein
MNNGPCVLWTHTLCLRHSILFFFYPPPRLAPVDSTYPSPFFFLFVVNMTLQAQPPRVVVLLLVLKVIMSSVRTKFGMYY